MSGLATDHAPDLSMGLDDMMPMEMDLSQLDDGAPPNATPTSFTPFSQQLQPGVAPPSSDVYALTQEGAATGAGAGPLPTGFGAPNLNPSGSTLTEFTKRRNWSQRVRACVCRAPGMAWNWRFARCSASKSPWWPRFVWQAN